MTAGGASQRYAWLKAALDEEAIIVTASRRLARDLKKSYADSQIAAGRTTWRTPPVHFLPDWLDRQLAEATEPAPRRLDSFSSQLLWERALGKQLPDGLPGTTGLVRQAIEAWRRTVDWEIPIDTLRGSARTEDEQAFAFAAVDYQAQLRDNGWVDTAGVIGAITGLLGDASADLRRHLPKSVVFAGFDRLSPATGRYQAALSSAGCRVRIQPPTSRNSCAVVTAYDDEHAELRAAGAWARRQLDASPNQSIGIVCPGLERRALESGQLVREGFVPGWQWARSAIGGVVDVSYGRPLAEYPAIGVALLILRWLGDGLTGKQVSVLLRSACWAGGEAGGRARVELALRQLPDRLWSAKAFLTWLESTPLAAAVPRFVEALGLVSSAAVDDERRRPAECVRQVDALLDTAGWPGESTLDSEAFQLVNRWRELLNEFARADTVLPDMPLGDIGRRLATLAADSIWQPEGADSVIQILGVLEAAGLEFDHVRFTGLDTAAWPPPARPSPFLSYALQRDNDMPDATPANSLAFARSVLDRIVSSSGQCVLSFARLRDDKEMACSTLLTDFDTADPDDDPGWHAAGLAGGSGIEVIDGDDARAVVAGERVLGGAYTVQRQYREPLAALASGRLGVRVPEPFRVGLSPGARGSLLHNALFNLLAGKPSQAQIAGWQDAERGRRIGSATDSAIGAHQQHADDVLMRLLGLERERLRKLLSDFLEHEADREAPFDIVAVEESFPYAAHGLSLDLRVDRIDRLEDGRLMIIDYKTGTPRTFVRRSGELGDLQPVLYAAAVCNRMDGVIGEPIAGHIGDRIGALLFQNVDSRKIHYSGAGDAWKETDDWPERLAGWLGDVDREIEALAGGDARIDIGQSVSDGRQLAVLSRLEANRHVC